VAIWGVIERYNCYARAGLGNEKPATDISAYRMAWLLIKVSLRVVIARFHEKTQFRSNHFTKVSAVHFKCYILFSDITKSSVKEKERRWKSAIFETFYYLFHHLYQNRALSVIHHLTLGG
jgi:hypothetical protein